MTESNQPVADTTSALRKQLISLLTGSNAHKSFDAAIKDLPTELRGVKPDKLPYSIWQIVDHIRIVQEDILDFSRNPNYQSRPWPDSYWTKDVAPTEEDWQQALKQIREDRAAIVTLINDPEPDFYTPFAHGDGQNLLREILLVADHTAYHVGEIIIIRRLLDAWN
ncbi:DinB family protein [Spirosoma endophyticum]|uniref:DinB superfamily protein n=1 Tax=Spirosoma endophyticum TaxID=662367 RepID=A0A1I1H288_9BACT|nr:DinB family protein [Spirosoma endophyticum]SFC15533.1 DinB superfamily protein [Spirosoma endophyticum]